MIALSHVTLSYGARPAVDTHAPDARIVLTIRGDRASMSLDLSGEPLFKRLSRTALARAPQGVDILRPDYAALVLAEAGFPELCQSARDAGTEPRLPVVINADGTTFYKTAFLEFYTRLYLDRILEKEHGRYFRIVNIDNSPTLGAAIAGLAI